ncbi:MAG: polymorphic toxin type 23 domain-containing protein, partial [Bacteroidota bacterium]
LSGWEYQYNLGGVLAVGGTPRHPNEILTPISNQTDKKYSIAYAYQEYIDRIGTSQSSGVIGLNLGQFEVAVENDIFGSLQDHFRTGGVQLAYRLEHTEIAINSTIWHGEAYGDNVHRHRDAPGYPSRFGYFDLSDAQYGKFSNGLASVQVKHVIPGGQVLQANLGVDAEQVRHALQNWLIHDMYYVPDKWVTYPNPHYPMLDPDGEPYLFKPGQQIRPVTPYFNFSVNGGLFY